MTIYLPTLHLPFSSPMTLKSLSCFLLVLPHPLPFSGNTQSPGSTTHIFVGVGLSFGA